MECEIAAFFKIEKCRKLVEKHRMLIIGRFNMQGERIYDK